MGSFLCQHLQFDKSDFHQQMWPSPAQCVDYEHTPPPGVSQPCQYQYEQVLLQCNQSCKGIFHLSPESLALLWLSKIILSIEKQSSQVKTQLTKKHMHRCDSFMQSPKQHRYTVKQFFSVELSAVNIRLINLHLVHTFVVFFWRIDVSRNWNDVTVIPAQVM